MSTNVVMKKLSKVNLHVDNARSKNIFFLKLALQKTSENGKAFNTFVRPQGYTLCGLVRNNACKHNFCLFVKKLCSSSLMSEPSTNKKKSLAQWEEVDVEYLERSLL